MCNTGDQPGESALSTSEFPLVLRPGSPDCPAAQLARQAEVAIAAWDEAEAAWLRDSAPYDEAEAAAAEIERLWAAGLASKAESAPGALFQLILAHGEADFLLAGTEVEDCPHVQRGLMKIQAALGSAIHHLVAAGIPVAPRSLQYFADLSGSGGAPTPDDDAELVRIHGEHGECVV